MADADRQFGKFSLVAKLATGGMAEIFLARLQGAAGFEKLVCIKRILPALAADPQFISMFLAEARIAAQISHPNVCQVFELGEIDGRYYIAMEYLEGVPLGCFRRRDLYKDQPSARLIAGLGLQACEGLHHAHQLKRPDGTLLEVVHRDISSNNLFATIDGVVKVLDFGIAKANQGGDRDPAIKTSTGSVKGTYAYMSPEQLRGQKLDRRTDVFALGIVLWELACRKHLFKRETEFLTYEAITQAPIADVRELRPDLPAAFAAVVAKALQRKKQDRYETARALGQALAESVAAQGGPLVASALSDEVERAFSSRLGEQRALIKVAREGGGFPLDEDLGPGVGHGSELMTTPVSMVSGQELPDDDDGGGGGGGGGAADQTRSATMTVKPLDILAKQRRRMRLLVAAPLIVVAGGGGAYGVLALTHSVPDKVAAAPPADARVVPPPAPDAAAVVVAVVVPPDAAPVAPLTEDAALIVEDAAVAAVVDAAASAAVDAAADVADAKPLPPPVPHPPPAPPVPHVVLAPGSITIDSAPYADIVIDGKRMGPTPIVGISLAAGRHSVRAIAPSGKAQTAVIVIEPGKAAPPHKFEW